MDNKKLFWYSIYLNTLSFVIGVLCIIYSFKINKFRIFSIILTIIVLAELFINVVNYHSNNHKKD